MPPVDYDVLHIDGEPICRVWRDESVIDRRIVATVRRTPRRSQRSRQKKDTLLTPEQADLLRRHYQANKAHGLSYRRLQGQIKEVVPSAPVNRVSLRTLHNVITQKGPYRRS